MLNPFHRKTDSQHIVGQPVLLAIVPAAEQEAEQTPNKLWHSGRKINVILQLQTPNAVCS
jgi:hypothetical protein